MRRGFTILELLVASLLLGMLLTILTMIFNQSSIAWRAGKAGMADMDDVRKDVAKYRYEADNVYVWDGQYGAVLSVFKKDGNPRSRSFSPATSDKANEEEIRMINGSLVKSPTTSTRSSERLDTSSCWDINLNGKSSRPQKTFTVNVRSAGPNRKHDDYDDIWSFPDDFDM